MKKIIRSSEDQLRRTFDMYLELLGQLKEWNEQDKEHQAGGNPPLF